MPRSFFFAASRPPSFSPAREPLPGPRRSRLPSCAPHRARRCARPGAPLAPRPSEVAGTRFLRVRLEEGTEGVALAADTLRAWDADGRLAAEASGGAAVDAIGDRVRFGGTKLLGGSIDVVGIPELRMGGRRIGGRVRVTARNGRLMAVAVVPLETYVAAVISREAPPLFHPEALKAQAVATRTYAVGATRKPRDPGFDVMAGVEDQVFEGMDDVAAVFREAAEETRGFVLLYRGEPARTVFHSTCGGRTESAANAWGKRRAVPQVAGLR